MVRTALVFISMVALTSPSQAARDSVAISQYNYKGDTLYTYVEEMPELNQDLGQFLASELQYPDEARDNGIQGKVTLGFVITRDGDIGAVVIVKSSGNAFLDEEGVRVIWALPPHIPGKHKGIPVHVYREFPIRFAIDR